MEKLIILPELINNSDWHEQMKRAERIMNQYFREVCSFPQKELSDVMHIILDSKYGQNFLNSMKQLKIERLYKSDIHGQDHVERVCILAAYLGAQLGVSMNMFKLCLEAAKYHDIGRRNDAEDRLHGYLGSKDIYECCEEFCEWDCEMIAAVVEAHSLLDDEARWVFDKYELLEPSDFEMYLQILNIVKDADALDRFRLTEHSLKVNFLRVPESLSVIQAACEMNQVPVRRRVTIVSCTEESVSVIQWEQVKSNEKSDLKNWSV